MRTGMMYDPTGAWIAAAMAAGCYVWYGGSFKLRLGRLEVILRRGLLVVILRRDRR